MDRGSLSAEKVTSFVVRVGSRMGFGPFGGTTGFNNSGCCCGCSSLAKIGISERFALGALEIVDIVAGGGSKGVLFGVSVEKGQGDMVYLSSFEAMDGIRLSNMAIDETELDKRGGKI